MPGQYKETSDYRPCKPSNSEGSFNNLCLLLLMHLCIACGGRGACTSTNDTIINILQIHLKKRCSAHIQRLLLYPKPNGFVIFFIEIFELLERHRIDLLKANDRHIIPVF